MIKTLTLPRLRRGSLPLPQCGRGALRKPLSGALPGQLDETLLCRQPFRNWLRGIFIAQFIEAEPATLDDFEAAFLKLRELGALDHRSHVTPIWELPDGSVQMYARDPAGNLIEVNWPDVSTLDRDVVGEIPRRADDVPQSDEGRRAKLYAR